MSASLIPWVTTPVTNSISACLDEATKLIPNRSTSEWSAERFESSISAALSLQQSTSRIAILRTKMRLISRFISSPSRWNVLSQLINDSVTNFFNEWRQDTHWNTSQICSGIREVHALINNREVRNDISHNYMFQCHPVIKRGRWDCHSLDPTLLCLDKKECPTRGRFYGRERRNPADPIISEEIWWYRTWNID